MPLGASQVVSDACPAAYGARLFHPDRHLCTLDPTPTASQACAGDSGGPVMVQRNGVWALAAVVTWGGETQGRDCGEGLPGRLRARRRARRAADRVRPGRARGRSGACASAAPVPSAAA